ncbi:magnesium transporter [Jatrophihabitans sp. GAS493]|uniref:magnesium transporter CorA family protein n=1 Tax=Jatrophihabitans sp. GAS493 TaxID=1907575 RepID=UPI000BB9A8A0|nr:magnesium transporter CorA family protein [Jatrophihabitans sp. GAS493]SOD70373.1 magnesium transporter [Jatrophihabitans sp. GAS493]
MNESQSDQRQHGVRTRVWRNGKLEAEDFPFDMISDYLEQPDCLVWADVCAPDTDRINRLADELSLDAHAVEDAVDEHERPKATHYRTHVFLTAYALHFVPETGVVEKTQVSAFAMPRALITVRRDESFDIETVVRVWDENSDLVRLGSRALVHGLLDVIVDSHFDCVEALDDEVESIEDTLFDTDRRTDATIQRRSFALRKGLVQARRAVLPMRELVAAVRRFNQEHPIGDVDLLEPYFNDLYDHVLRATEWTESLRDMITSIFETNLSLADARMNMIMKKLTAWAAIIAVPTAITGFYGQNVPYPWFGKDLGFWFSTAAILLMSFALWVSFRRRDWL